MKRWIVRDAEMTATNGNGVWAETWTKAGARHVLTQILTFQFGTYIKGAYTIPAGGLVIVRASEAFPRHRDQVSGRGRF